MFRRAFMLLLVAVSGSTGAFAQPPADCRNVVGIYTDPAPTAGTIADLVMYEGVPGEFDAYIVLTNPYNTSLDQPITVVGGFEFRIEVPAGVFLLSAFLPPNTTNFAGAPGEFLCSTNLPVVDGAATCVSITLGAFTQTENHIRVTPVADAPQTYPGEIVITDFNDDFRISLAQPSSGDFAAPVFGLWPAEGVQLLPCLLPAPDLRVELPPTVAVEATLGDTVSVVVRVTNLGTGSDTIGFSIADTTSGFSIDDPLLAVADADSTILRFVPTAEGTASTQLTALQTGTGLAQVFDLVGAGFVAGRYVSPDGDDDNGDGTRNAPWATIQFAIGQADTGDAVVLLDGTYRGDGNRDLDFLRKGVLVRSAGGDPAAVIIDCDGTEAERHVGIHFRPGEPAGTAVEGVTIRDAYGPAAMPAAVHIEGGAGPGDEAVATIRFARCVIDSSRGAGVRATGPSGHRLTFTDCLVSHNSGAGVDLFMAASGSSISGCRFEGNGGAGLRISFGDIGVADCEFLHNVGTGCVFASDEATDQFHLGNSTLAFNGTGFGGYGVVEGCVVHDNTGSGIAFYGGNGLGRATDCDVYLNGGHGFKLDGGKRRAGAPADKAQARIENSRVHANGGNGVYSTVDQVNLSGLVVYGNAGTGIFVENYLDESSITRCTVAHNGAGMELAGFAPGTVTDSIIAFNGGCGLSGDVFAPGGAPLWTFANNDVYANTGGDSCVDGLPVPGAGFIAKDPLFCDAAAGDYGLAANSPCAGSALQNLVGALSTSCAGVDAPVLLSVADIPEDQGGQVRLVWLRSGRDESGSAFPVLGYDVYRRATPGASAERGGDGAKLLGWDYVLRVPARGDQGYQTVAPTLWDSTAADGPRATVFLVSAVTADPLVFFDSAPDSGWSVDNLAPDAPDTVTVAYSALANDVQWSLPDAPDVVSYDIWRTGGAELPLEAPGPRTTNVPVRRWRDTEFEGSAWDQKYWIAAVDHAGNRGPLTRWDSAGLSATPDQDLPTAFALRGNVPNPFNPMTSLRFDLPRAARVELEIFDVAGRRVVRLVSGETYPAGRHEVVWQGRNDAGQTVAAGVYISRLRADGDERIGRMLLLK